MAAIAVVHMEPQWPLLQPTVPYVYGTYPAYHQVRVVPVVPKTKSVAPKKPISLKPKTYSLDYLSSEGCEVVDFIQRELRYLDSLFRVCDRDDDGIQTYECYNPSCEDYFLIIMMIRQTLMILISIMTAQSHSVKFCVRLNSSIPNQMNLLNLKFIFFAELTPSLHYP